MENHNAKLVPSGGLKPNPGEQEENPTLNRCGEEEEEVNTESAEPPSPNAPQSSRTPFTNLSQVDADLALARTLQEQFLMRKVHSLVESSVLNEEGGDTREDLDDHTGDEEEGEGSALGDSHPWQGSDRDYHYEELLGRVFNILRENNPELAGDRRRTTMRPPQVLREGTKKTVFVNFMDLCKTMHRQPDHVMAFLLAELGTSGSLDGQQRLVVKGRFAPKNFEGILRRYVNEYVICIGCKSPDTILSKDAEDRDMAARLMAFAGIDDPCVCCKVKDRKG
ncbi:hypothetical protein ACLB2K_001962 [Fragaria x ananassa]